MGGGAVANEACEIHQAKKGNHNMDVCACAGVQVACLRVRVHICACAQNPTLAIEIDVQYSGDIADVAAAHAVARSNVTRRHGADG